MATKTNGRDGMAPVAAHTESGAPQPDDLPAKHNAPYVWARAYPPGGQRRHWLLIVDQCFACGGGHAHRGGPNGGLRRAGCGRATYFVKPRLSPTVQRGAA